MLGLTSPVNGIPSNDTKIVSTDANDVFGYFVSETSNGKITTTTASQPASVTKECAEPSLEQLEQDFFNHVTPNEKEKAKMTKDSILALYGTAPTMNRLPGTNQFGTQGMPVLNNDNNAFATTIPLQYQQQSTFGAVSNNMNNFPQFGIMQQQQAMNFQSTMNSTLPNQSIGFPSISHASQSLPSFTQPNANNPNQNNAFTTVAHNPTTNNVNQQFGSLNLSNVWQ